MNEVAKTKGQLADVYGISIRTLNKWLKAENIVLTPGLISPRQQLNIIRKLGNPVSPLKQNHIDDK